MQERLHSPFRSGFKSTVKISQKERCERRPLYDAMNKYGIENFKGGDGTILYDYKEIIQLANLGYTSDQIERKIGCCKSTIYKVA